MTHIKRLRIRPFKGGRFFVNKLDLYKHLANLNLKYLPQADVIRRNEVAQIELAGISQRRLSVFPKSIVPESSPGELGLGW
jgi:hypothetical protein